MKLVEPDGPAFAQSQRAGVMFYILLYLFYFTFGIPNPIISWIFVSGRMALERPLLFLIRSRTDLYASFRFVLTDFKAKSFRRRRLFHFLFSCRVNDRPDTNEHDRQYRWLLEVRDRRAQSTGKEAYTSFPDSHQVVWSNEC